VRALASNAPIGAAPDLPLAACSTRGDRRRTLEFHDIALGIAHVDRRTIAFGAVALLDRTGCDAVSGEPGVDCRCVERFDTQAKVIEVATLASRRGAALAAELAGDRHEVDQRGAGPQLDQADVVEPPFDPAAECVAIETQHAVEVDDAQDEVIEAADRQRFHEATIPAGALPNPRDAPGACARRAPPYNEQTLSELILSEVILSENNVKTESSTAVRRSRAARSARPVRRSRAEQLAATRRELVQAGLRVVAEQGFAGATTAAIAQACGKAHGTVFVHFRTRDALVAELVEEVGRAITQRLAQMPTQSTGVAEVLDAHLAALAEHEVLYTRLLRDATSLPAAARARVFALQSGIAWRLRHAHARDLERRKVRAMNPVALGNTWIALTNHYLLNRDLFAPGASVMAARGAELKAQLLEMLRP